MTRPIIPPAPFELIAAPSKSRPALPVEKVREDADRVRLRMGECGVAGFTEISRPEFKSVIRELFPHRVGLAVSDCPIVWTDAWEKVDGGVDFGARGIPIVAPPARHTTWVILRRKADGYVLGFWFAHLDPGGFVAHPMGAQRRLRSTIQLLWGRHARRIQRRITELEKRCDLVTGGGDINRPRLWTWLGLVRRSKRGLLYVGVGPDADATVTYFDQNADHQGAEATVYPHTPKEPR